jgi:hypothetical protein
VCQVLTWQSAGGVFRGSKSAPWSALQAQLDSIQHTMYQYHINPVDLSFGQLVMNAYTGTITVVDYQQYSKVKDVRSLKEQKASLKKMVTETFEYWHDARYC